MLWYQCQSTFCTRSLGVAIFYRICLEVWEKTRNFANKCWDFNEDRVKFDMRKAIVILCLVLAQTIVAQTKIVVLSDIHVMAPSLLVNNGPAWKNLLDADRKLLDFSRPLFDEAVERIKTIQPKLVLITGDLTKDGETVSHEYVVKKLDELKAAGIMTLVIPGNHDIDRGDAAVAYDGGNTTVVASPSLDEFASLYADYGYGAGSVFDGLSKTYCCEPVDGLVIVGINSGKYASISSETLDWVCKQASAATAAGKKIVVMMHHALNLHITNSDLFASTSVIDRSDEIRQRLIDAGVRVILTGHFHTSDIAKDFNESLTEPIYDIATGALASYPCDYRELTFSKDLSELKVETGHITSIEGNSEFTPYVAKERLHASVLRTVKEVGLAKLREKYGALGAAAFESTIKSLAKEAANAYIIHAEGDEHKVDTEKLLALFTGDLINKVIPGCHDMICSMLKDLSPYGVEGRENQTDDLSLTIDMGLPVPTGINAVAPTIDSQRCYDLNGHQLQAPPANGLLIYKQKKYLVSQ